MKKLPIFLPILCFLIVACSDDTLDESQVNYVSAKIDSVDWKASETYTQKARGENGPLIIVGEGEDYMLELRLGGIDKTGTYQMGTTRSGRITLGSTTYSTMDVPDAGTIEITRFQDNELEGTFHFSAQWLSANNRLEVEEGKFKVFYY